MTGADIGETLSRRRFRRTALALLLLHAASLAWLAFATGWTRDEYAYLKAGAILRQELSWDVAQTTFHGPLPYFANQTFAWLLPVEPADAYKPWGRLGMLPFSLLCAAALLWWARQALGRRGALCALGLHVANPVVLANGCLMTTDMALAATYTVSIAALWRWLTAPRLATLLLFGAAAGAALATKYLALFLVPVAGTVVLWAWASGFDPHRRRAGAGPLRRGLSTAAAMLLAGGVALVALHSCYLWSVGGYRLPATPAAAASVHVPGSGPLSAALRRAVDWPLVEPLLALLPEPFVRGADFQKLQSEQGGLTPFLDRIGAGHPGYFLVSLAVKLPLAWLALLAAGIAARPVRLPVRFAAVAGIGFAVPFAYLSLFSVLQNGIRNLLLLMPILAIVAGRAAEWLLRGSGRRRLAAGAAAAALVVCHAITAPRYISAFNTLASRRPYLLFTDSNLDWTERQPVDRQVLAARHPGATRIGPHAGPRFGSLLVCGTDLAPVDSRQPDRVHHWLRRFHPVDRLGAWFVFVIDEGVFRRAPGAESPRARAELAVALLGSGAPQRALAEIDGSDDPLAPAVRAAASLQIEGLARSAAYCQALLELGRHDLVVAADSGATPTQRATAHWSRGEMTEVRDTMLALELTRTLQPAEVGLLAGAWNALGDDDAALAVLDRYRPAADSPALPVWEQLRRGFAESAGARRRLHGR